MNIRKTVFASIVLSLSLLPLANGQMLDDTIRIDDVIVTGTRVSVARNVIPATISVVTSEELNSYHESAIFPLLSRRIPGIFVTEHSVAGFGVGANSSGVMNIRGVGGIPNTQVLTLVDGHPQYMGIFGHPLPNSYVASDLDRVEIIRGPSSILYGSNAMGGAVNMITRRQQTDGLSANARVAYGTFNTLKLMASSGYRQGGMHLFVSFNHDATDGHRDTSAFAINNAYVKAGYDFTENLSLVVDYNIARFEDTNPGISGEGEGFKDMADILRGKASISLQNRSRIGEGALNLYYNYGDHSLSTGWESIDETYGIGIYQSFSLPYSTTITTGGDFKKVAGRGNQGARANEWISNNETALYILIRHEIMGRMNITYGIRAERSSLYGIEPVPQGGITWQADPYTTLRASVAKGFRNPTLRELYLFAPNPELEPETMVNYEAGISRVNRAGNLSATLTLYLINGDNLIVNVPNDLPQPPMIGINSGEFSNRGFETEIEYRLSRALSSYISYSYLSTERPLLAAPRHQLYGGVDWKRERFSAGAEAIYTGGLYTVAGESHSSDDNVVENYFLLNARASYSAGESIQLFVSGKNLLGTEYQIRYGYPMPGAHIMAGVSLRR